MAQEQITVNGYTLDMSIYNALTEFIARKEASAKKTRQKHHAVHTVQPLKDNADIQAARDYFLNQPLRYKNSPTNIRNYALFVLGINCARRVSDMLALRVSDVRFATGEYKNYVEIREQKTDKVARFILNNDAVEALDMLITASNYGQNDFLFKSSKGENQPIDYRSAWRIMKNMETALGFDKRGINIGTHTMRKTAAYNIYNNTKDIMLTARVLNHSSPAITRRYIGIEQDEADAALAGLDYSAK